MLPALGEAGSVLTSQHPGARDTSVENCSVETHDPPALTKQKPSVDFSPQARTMPSAHTSRTVTLVSLCILPTMFTEHLLNVRLRERHQANEKMNKESRSLQALQVEAHARAEQHVKFNDGDVFGLLQPHRDP